MIRSIELNVVHGVVAEAPKQFELRFFLNFRKFPVSLWISTDMKKSEVIGTLLDFIKRLFDNMDSE
jgi:hypothetical protein